MRVNINGTQISSPYGATEPFRSKPHTGIDLPMKEGTELHSLADGIVQKVYDGSGNIGEGVKIRLNDGTYHIFGHMNEVSVKKGDIIKTGQLIGESGNTGRSTGGHLHFAVQQSDGSFVDPTVFAPAITANSTHSMGFMDRINNFTDNAVYGQLEFLFRPVVNGFGKLFVHLGEWIVSNLPELMGYGTIAAGILIVINSMLGGASMMKVFGWYVAAMIISICLLGGS